MDVTRQRRPQNRGGEVMIGNWLEEVANFYKQINIIDFCCLSFIFFC